MVVTIILLITAGNTFAQHIRSTRTIKLSGYTSTYSYTIENDSAIISFSLPEVRAQLTSVKAKKQLKENEAQMYLDNALDSIRTDKDYTFYCRDIFSAGVIEQSILRKLITNGRANVFDKLTMQYVKRISRTHYRSTIAGERHEEYRYAFVNGVVFLIDIVSI